MSFGEAVQSVFRNYAKFDGRALRSEYWWFQLFNVLVVVAAYAVIIAFYATGRTYSGASIPALALVIYALAAFIPNLAVTVRRLHDSDKSGWWLLLVFIPLGSLVLLIFMILDSTPGPNRFGPPHGVSSDSRYAWYRGASPADALASYTEDARRAAAAGYEPVSQQWRRDAGGDYLEVIYHPTRQQAWNPAAWNPQTSGPSVKQHPFDGPPPDGSVGA